MKRPRPRLAMIRRDIQFTWSLFIHWDISTNFQRKLDRINWSRLDRLPSQGWAKRLDCFQFPIAFSRRGKTELHRPKVLILTLNQFFYYHWKIFDTAFVFSKLLKRVSLTLYWLENWYAVVCVMIAIVIFLM